MLNLRRPNFLLYKCIFILNFLTYGSLAEGSELTVTGTAFDISGILSNLIIVTVDGITTKQADYNEINGEWTATFGVENGPHSVTASGYDNCGNSFTTPEKIFCVGGITLNINNPTDGSVSGTGGFSYVSCNVTGTKDIGGQAFVIAELPFTATFTDYSETGPGTFYVTVDSKDGDGSIRQADGQFTLTSSAPTAGQILGTVTGYIEVSLPVNAGSDGLSHDVVIVATINNVAGIGPNTDTSTITVQLAHFGVDPVTEVYDTLATFKVQICAFVDPADAPFPNGFAGYDFDLTWNSAVFTYAGWGNGTCGFDSPIVAQPGGAGTLRIGDSSTIFCTGWVKLPYLTFNRVGVAGSSSSLTIQLAGGDPKSFVDRYNNPLPSNRNQDGFVSIIPTPVPEITRVCNADESICNPALVPVGSGQGMVITGNDFDCAGGVIITFSSGAWIFSSLDICSATRLEINVATFGGLTDVIVTNNTTGMSDTCFGCADTL